MTFKLGEAAMEHLKILYEERVATVQVPVSPDTGGRRYVEFVCPVCLEQDGEVLAEFLERVPSEVLYMSHEGLAVQKAWLRGLLRFNGHDPDGVVSHKAADRTVSRASQKAQPPKEATSPASTTSSSVLTTLNAVTFGAVRRPQKRDWVVTDANAIALVLEFNKDMKEQRRTMLTAFKTRSLRTLPRVTDPLLKALDTLEVQMPNFTAVIEHIRNHLVLLKLTGAPLALPPILLLGPPGVGKTHFAKAISKSLGLHLHIRSMAETSASFVFIGSHSTWSSAQLGAVARLVMETPDRLAPALLVDEVDRCSVATTRQRTCCWGFWSAIQRVTSAMSIWILRSTYGR